MKVDPKKVLVADADRITDDFDFLNRTNKNVDLD
jgi:hypothetical protein